VNERFFLLEKGYMQKIIAVGFGGFLGAIARYFISGYIQNKMFVIFPIGTFVVNIVGSFIIGFLWELFNIVIFSQNMKLLILTGFIGAFTTFSTFSLEVVNLFQEKEYFYMILYLVGTNILGISFVFLGIFISRFMVFILRG